MPDSLDTRTGTTRILGLSLLAGRTPTELQGFELLAGRPMVLMQLPTTFPFRWTSSSDRFLPTLIVENATPLPHISPSVNSLHK